MQGFPDNFEIPVSDVQATDNLETVLLL
ncbi:hypothetical protein [Candidatus Liberibacter asiaticus]